MTCPEFPSRERRFANNIRIHRRRSPRECSRGDNGEFLGTTLPTWALPELERLQLRQESLRLRAEFVRKQKHKPFSFPLGESGFLRETLGRIVDFGDDDEAPAQNLAMLAGCPVEGVVMYIEWMAIQDSPDLYSPPIESLWRLGPSALRQPMSILFKVAASGEVIEVLTPIEEDNELAGSAGKALLKYRFAPLLAGRRHNHRWHPSRRARGQRKRHDCH